MFLSLDKEKLNYLDEVPKKLEQKIGEYKSKEGDQSYSTTKGNGETFNKDSV